MKIFGSTITLLGRPGCGKGTQSKLLIEWLQNRYGGDVPLSYVYVGSACRELAKAATPEGERMKAILDAGGIPPTDLVEFVMLNPLRLAESAKIVLYDGSPRLIAEARMIDAVCRDRERPPLIPIHVDVPHDECLRRLRSADRGRTDDREKIIQNRFAGFDTEVMEVLDYYSSAGRLITINGNRELTDVFDELMEKLFKQLS